MKRQDTDMLKKLEKKYEFANSYSGENDSIKLSWKVPLGFDTLEEAEQAVESEGQNPEEFSYVLFSEMYYAIGLSTRENIVAVGKEFIWYWSEYKCVYERFKLGELSEPKYLIEKARIATRWDDSILLPFREKDPEMRAIPARAARNKKILGEVAPAVLAQISFDTLIPVYQLDVVNDMCFNPPIKLDLGKSGICSYNPFNDEREHRYNDGSPYTYEDYVNEVEGRKQKEARRNTKRRIELEGTTNVDDIIGRPSEELEPITADDLSRHNEETFLQKLNTMTEAIESMKAEIAVLKSNERRLGNRISVLESIIGQDIDEDDTLGGDVLTVSAIAGLVGSGGSGSSVEEEEEKTTKKGKKSKKKAEAEDEEYVQNLLSSIKSNA